MASTDAVLPGTPAPALERRGNACPSARRRDDRRGVVSALLVRAQLALARRGDWFLGAERDEELQRVGRAFLVRLG
ncbi:hypothetical protein AB0D33_04355 [Streptomyces sp. NPDC048404]|uniref:hypothetical protein n=1 Tax=unclassified Streptomyces TaxID=2593676 RepID=UPI003449BA6E